jgi:hypothetical protein
MTKLSFAKNDALRLLLAGSMLFLSFPIVNAFGANAPCLAQFADSAWSQGEPKEVLALLNRNLLLTQVKVVPSSTFDFGGVISADIFQGSRVDFGPTLPTSPKYLYQSGPYNDGQVTAKNYLTHTYEYSPTVYKSEIKPFQYFDVRVGAVARKAPITVFFDYKGADCADRTISVSSFIDIVPIETLNTSTATDDQITDFLKRNNYSDRIDFLGLRNQLARVRNIEAWFKYTKKEPIPIIFPKGVSAKTAIGRIQLTTGYSWDTHPGVNGLMWIQPYADFRSIKILDSTDGCITNKNQDKFINLINRPNLQDNIPLYFASKKNVCRVFLHILNTDFDSHDTPVFAPEQIVVEGWVTKAVIPAKNQQYLPSIFCSDGKVFKVITAKNPTCPTCMKIISK